MSSYGSLPIFSLPTFVRNLHGLRCAREADRRAVSTVCRLPSVSPRLCGINSRPFFPSGRVAGASAVSKRFESASTRRRKARASEAQSGVKSDRDSPKNKLRERRQKDRVRGGTASDSRKGPVDGISQDKPEGWRIQKEALQQKFKEGWKPRKRLSPDAIEGVRYLHETDPGRFSTPILAEHFKISPEAVRRILKSKWRPNEKEAEQRRQRWDRRKVRVWNHMAEIGLRPQKKEFAPLSDAEGLNDTPEPPDEVPEENQK